MTAPRRDAERLYTIAQAAELASVAEGTIRAAIKATEGNILAAKNIGTGGQPRYRISASALDAWFSRMEDA